MDDWKYIPAISLEEFLKFGEYDDTIRDKKRNETDCDYERWQKVVNKAKELSVK